MPAREIIPMRAGVDSCAPPAAETPATPETTLETLSALSAQGWPLFPCHTVNGAGCSCHDPGCSRVGKHPRTEHGLLDATTDASQLRFWNQRFPGCNWAVRTGPESNLVVVDADPGSEPTLAAWDQEHGTAWRETLSAMTPRGGLHLLFQHPALGPGMKVKTSNNDVAPGIDIRGAGGYAIIAPSRGQAGDYRWVDPSVPIAAAPDWLLEKIVVADSPAKT